MKKIINNIILSISEDINSITLSASSKDNIIFKSTIPLESMKNNFLIPKIKDNELLNILSSNLAQEKEQNTEYTTIKIYQIKHNLKKIIEQSFKYNKEYINFINIGEIEDILNEIQYRFSDIKKEEYIKDNYYLNLIIKVLNKIKIIIKFMIENNKETKQLLNEIFIIKNFNNFVLFENPKKILQNKKLLNKQKIFYTYKNEKYKNILPYNNIYHFSIHKKLIFYKFDTKKEMYIIYYSYNVTREDKKIIKTVINGKFLNLNRMFKNNNNFNTKNTKFTQIKNIHINRIFIEKMLLELEENTEDYLLEEEEYEIKTIQNKHIKEIKINNEEENIDEEINYEKEEIIKQINKEHKDIFVHEEDFDKEIEEKIFF